jgi:hypothetical protein
MNFNLTERTDHEVFARLQDAGHRRALDEIGGRLALVAVLGRVEDAAALTKFGWVKASQ